LIFNFKFMLMMMQLNELYLKLKWYTVILTVIFNAIIFILTFIL